MKKVIHKLFFAWNFEKEEQWLNEMASKGLVLTYAGFGKPVTVCQAILKNFYVIKRA